MITNIDSSGDLNSSTAMSASTRQAQVCDARAYKLELWGCSSVGERLLCKQEVTGSNPVSSTRRRRAAIGDSVSYPLMEARVSVKLSVSTVSLNQRHDPIVDLAVELSPGV